MKSVERLQKTSNPIENQRQSLQIFRTFTKSAWNQQTIYKSLRIHGKKKNNHRFSWLSHKCSLIVVYFLWASMNFYVFSADSISFSWFFYRGFLLIPMTFCRRFVDFISFHGLYTDFHRFSLAFDDVLSICFGFP